MPVRDKHRGNRARTEHNGVVVAKQTTEHHRGCQ
jgi:hypothetical protein